MTAELEVSRPAQDSWVSVVGDVWRLSDAIARTEFVPSRMRGKPEAVAACILTGRELGLGPMTSLRGIDVIDGSPSLSTELLAARMLAAGHRIMWREVSDKTVTVKIARGDELSEAEVSWSLRDAERAGLLNKQNWQKYPRAMLRARALAECAQLVCPDVSLGLDTTQAATSDERPAVQLATVEIVTEPEAEERPPVPPSASADEKTADAAEDIADDVLLLMPETFVSEPEAQAEAEPSEPEPYLGGLAEFAHPVADAPPVSAGQIRALNAILRDIERASNKRYTRDERRARIMWAADLQDNPKDSQTDLTREEAGRAIQRLGDMLAMMRRNPQQQTEEATLDD